MHDNCMEAFPRPTHSAESENTTVHESPREPLLSEEITKLLERFETLSGEEVKAALTDMSERIAALERTSRTDELTGLLNRRGFREEVQRLESLFARERRDEKAEIPSALLALDLDGFKEVNDTCGHAGGDRCLQLISERIRGVLRESDVFARVGGDEFSIFLSQDDEHGAATVAEKVRTVIEKEVTETMRKEYPGYQGQLSASIGIVPIDSKGVVDGKVAKVDELASYADYAAYVVKAAGKKGELTLRGAREVDADGKFQADFLSGKTLPR